MEKKEYIISFGDSRQYRFQGTPDELLAAERRLDDYLKAHFPGQNFAYIVLPHMRQLREEEVAAYADYPLFDDKAMSDVEAVLARELQVRAADRELNNNAPFADA